MPELALEFFTLSNGIRVVLHRQPSVHRVSIMLNIGAGCIDERVWGTAHMLEHLMFRGTRKYPSFGAISEAFEQVGADFNAFTAREVTSFDINLPRESVADALMLLGDVMMHAKLTGIVAERDIIREEILADYDDDNALINVDDLMTSLFYGDAGHPIAGNPQDIEKITSKDVRSFYEDHYAADNMLLVCTGAIPPTRDLQQMAESALGQIAPHANRSNRRQMPDIYKNPAPGSPALLHIKDYDGATQSDVSLGFLFDGPHSPQLPALEILVRILDDGMASRPISARLSIRRYSKFAHRAAINASQSSSKPSMASSTISLNMASPTKNSLASENDSSGNTKNSATASLDSRNGSVLWQPKT